MNKNSKDSEKEELLDGNARTISSGSSPEKSELIKGVFKEWRKRGFTVNPFDDQIILITSEIKDKLHQQKIKKLELDRKDSLELIDKIRRRVVNQMKRKDGAYDQTAEDIRKILIKNKHKKELKQ